MENVNFDFKGAYQETDEQITLHLSRQGVTQTRNCGHPKFFVEIGADYKNEWYAQVHYANNDNYPVNKQGQTFRHAYKFKTEEEAIEFAMQHVADLCGKTVVIGSKTIHYCHGWTSYDFEKDDMFLSPVFYCEYSDTVRHYPSNYCLVAFDNGEFKQHKTGIDASAEKYLPQIEEAIKRGFHQCDLKKGDDHCKRRLAWLLGCYVAREHNEGRAAWCNLDMTKAQ